MGKLWRDQMQQEEWAARIKQHNEHFEELKTLRKGMGRFYELVLQDFTRT